MANKWSYGNHQHKSKKVKGFRNGQPVTYNIMIWRKWYDTSDPKAKYYAVTWEVEGNWSFNGGYGTGIKTNIKSLEAANKVVTSATNKIKKHTAPFK